MSAHSPFGPSRAARCIACPGSVRLAASLPEPPSSPAAREGTLAHAWAAFCLGCQDYDATRYVGVAMHAVADMIGEKSIEPLTAEMARHINQYLKLVESLLCAEDHFYVEKRFSLAPYFDGTKDGDGTADCVVYHPGSQHLDVLDLKYGAGVTVSIENNPQALQYALGATLLVRPEPVKSVTLWIVQPRAGGVKSFTLSRLDLWEYGETLKAAYQASKAVDAPFIPGDHCMFCPAKHFAKCPALNELASRTAAKGFIAVDTPRGPKAFLDPVDARELGAKLDQAKLLRMYLTALEELARSEAKAGRMPFGYKWVAAPGKRVWRADSDGEVSKRCRAAGVDAFEPLTLKTAPALEKELGDEIFASFADLIEKTKGGFALAPLSDKRPAAEYSAYHSADGFTQIK